MRDLALAAAAGTLAAVNPCGFAMLPAYLVLFSDRPGGHTRPVPALGRALRTAGIMTLGFATVFGAIGVVLTPAASAITHWAPAMTVIIGAVLALVGLAALAGRGIRLRLPHLRVDTERPAAAFVYGLSYAITSLGCSIGPFLVIVGATFRRGDLFVGVATYLAYAAGMGLVVGLAGSIVALAGAPGARRLGRAGRIAPRVGGCLLGLVGAYICWYGIYELRLRSSADLHDPIVATATAIQSRVAARLDRCGLTGLIAALGAALLLAASIGRRGESAIADGNASAPRPRFGPILSKLLRQGPRNSRR